MRILLAFLLALTSLSCTKAQVNSNGYKISPSPIVLPVVDAGDNQTIAGPTGTLTGSATSANGAISTYAWTQQSGPNTAGITTPAAASTGLTGLIVGTYIFRLTATDVATRSNHADVTINVTGSAPLLDTVFVYGSFGQSNQEGRVLDSFQYANGVLQVPGVQVFNWPDRTMRPFEYDRYNGGSAVGSPRWSGDIIVLKKVFDSLRGGIGDSAVLFKTTQGSTAMNFSPTYTGSWYIPQDSVTGSGDARMVDSMTNRWNDFKAAWNGRGYYVKMVAIMWHQGESDNLAPAPANYGTRLIALFSYMRTLFNEPNLKIIMGGIPTYSTYYNSTVEGAKLALVDNVDIFYIDMNGQPLKVDNTHFGATGQIYYGNEAYRIIKTFGR